MKPQAPPGIPREALPNVDIARQLVGKKGVTGGTIQSGFTTVQVDTDPATWLADNASTVDAEFSVSSGSKDATERVTIRINPSDPQHVKLLKDATDTVTHVGATLTEFSVKPCYSGGCHEREWTIHATTQDDRSSVDLTRTLIKGFDNHRISVTSPGLELTDSSKDRSSSTPVTDPQLVLDTLTNLISAGIRVEQVSVDRNSFTVRVDRPRELNSALKVFASAQPAGPATTSGAGNTASPGGTPKSATTSGNDRDAPTLSVAYGKQHYYSRLTLAEWNQRAPMVMAAWETGFTDLMVRESRNRNADFEITLTPPASGSAFDPGYLRAAAQAFRSEQWPGTAFVVLSEDNHPSFTSTSCGKAQNVRNMMAGASQKLTDPEQAFVDAWDATATC